MFIATHDGSINAAFIKRIERRKGTDRNGKPQHYNVAADKPRLEDINHALETALGEDAVRGLLPGWSSLWVWRYRRSYTVPDQEIRFLWAERVAARRPEAKRARQHRAGGGEMDVVKLVASPAARQAAAKVGLVLAAQPDPAPPTRKQLRRE